MTKEEMQKKLEGKYEQQSINIFINNFLKKSKNQNEKVFDIFVKNSRELIPLEYKNLFEIINFKNLAHRGIVLGHEDRVVMFYLNDTKKFTCEMVKIAIKSKSFMESICSQVDLDYKTIRETEKSEHEKIDNELETINY